MKPNFLPTVLLGLAMVLLLVLVPGVLPGPSMGETLRSSSGNGSADKEARAALEALLRAQAAAWNRGDLEGFMAGYWKSPETTFSGADGLLRGWRTLLNRYRSHYPDRQTMGRLKFSNLEITLLGNDAALILGQWRLHRETDQPGGVFTLVARRFPQGWRIIHDHTSAVAAKP